MLPPDRSADLRADCAHCVALCCVALPFTASVDFAFTKPAGTPCRHLDGFACGIHQRLADDGMSGCVAYDCFGAGQRVAQVTFAGRDWRAEPALAPEMFAAFAIMRDLHELLWYLDEAIGWALDGPLGRELRRAADDLRHRTAGSPDELAALDRDTVRADLAALLRQASARRRGPDGTRRRGADLAGADLRRTDLRGADLRGALLIRADLRDTDLARADLIGADLRDADLRGAKLADALFVTRQQVASARTDPATTLPPRVR